MKNNKILIGTMTLLMWASSIYAQDSYTLKGTVVSPYGNEPISEAVITVPGTTTMVKSDENGTFSISVYAGAEIEIWAPGYKNMVQDIVGSEMRFVMVPQTKRNYVESYATPVGDVIQKDKASAMENLNKEDFIPSGLYIDDVINSSIAGLKVTKSGGMPGEGSYMNTRGIASLVAGTSPLVVIDGVPYLPDMNESPIIGGFSSNMFNAFSASDIQKVTLLKGSEAAIYGSMGSNGVLLIETDDATDLETRVSLYCQYGVSSLAKEMPVMGVDDYKTYVGDIALTRYEDMADIVSEFPFLKDDPTYHYNFLYNNDNDWQDMIMNPSFVTENVLKIKGGDAIAKYDFSFGYLNHDGIVDNSDFSRYHMRLNSNINISKKLDFFASMSMAKLSNNLHEQGLIPETNPIMVAMAKSPLVSAYQKDEYNHELPDYATIDDGEGGIKVNNAVSNPLALVNSSQITSEGFDVLMNGGLNYRVNNEITLTGTVGLYYDYNRSEFFMPGVSSRTVMPLVDGLANNSVSEGLRETFNMYYGVKANYNNTFGSKHKLNAVVGWQAIKSSKEFDAGAGRNTSSDFYKTLDNVSTIGRSFFGYIDLWNWMNAYLHGTYTYNNLVSVGLNASIDGASSFGDDAPRFGLFPAVNAAFYLNNLEGLRSIDFINRLAVRGEYAVTGNSNFESNLSDYYYVNQVFRDLSGIVRAGIPNTGLRWEKTNTLNFGIDFTGFNQRLDLSLDYYNRVSSDVILLQKISSAFGESSLYDNVATINNSGIEASVQGYIVNTRDFNFLLGATVAFNKNEMKDMGGESDIINDFSDGSAVITREGESVYTFYGYETKGVFATSAEAKEANLVNYAGTAYQAGDVEYVDQNNDNKIDKYDRVVLGNPNPTLFGSVYASVNYKRFTLDAQFSYSYGNKIYNALRRNFESMKGFENQLISVNNRWQEEGDVTDMPRAVYGDPVGNNDFSDRFIEDGSYLKLRALTLSYAFKNGDMGIVEGGSVFVSAENIFTLSKYLGYDPELSYSYDPSKQGIDFGKVPQPRTFKFGFKLQF